MINPFKQPIIKLAIFLAVAVLGFIYLSDVSGYLITVIDRISPVAVMNESAESIRDWIIMANVYLIFLVVWLILFIKFLLRMIKNKQAQR
jgi:hypothetical protein